MEHSLIYRYCEPDSRISLFRMLYLLLTVETGSAKYYFAWGIGQAAACCVGISYNGLDENKNAKW